MNLNLDKSLTKLLCNAVLPYQQIKDGFAEGKDLILSVMSSMGEEQICAVKEIGAK